MGSKTLPRLVRELKVARTCSETFGLRQGAHLKRKLNVVLLPQQPANLMQMNTLLTIVA